MTDKSARQVIQISGSYNTVATIISGSMMMLGKGLIIDPRYEKVSYELMKSAVEMMSWLDKDLSNEQRFAAIDEMIAVLYSAMEALKPDA
jgi:hypothetical protein